MSEVCNNIMEKSQVTEVFLGHKGLSSLYGSILYLIGICGYTSSESDGIAKIML